MEVRFGKTQVLVARLVNLVPSIIATLTDISYEEVTSFYSDDLPSPALVPTEMWRWREKCCKEDPAVRPETLQTALKACDKDFPPIFTYFCIWLHFTCNILRK